MVELEPMLAEAEQAQADKRAGDAGQGPAAPRRPADEAILRELVERHLLFTGSTRALAILDNWDAARRASSR